MFALGYVDGVNTSHTHTHGSTVHGCHKGKNLKRGCSCTVAVSKNTAFEGWCGIVAGTGAHQQSAKIIFLTIWGFPVAWLSLTRRKAIPRKEPACRDFERPERAPRSPAGDETCVKRTARPPACPAAENAKKTQRLEKQCMAMCKKTTIGTWTYQVYIIIFRSTVRSRLTARKAVLLSNR